MKQSSGDRATASESSDRIAEIVDEIIQRLQGGEPVSWESYYERYPQHAAQLQELQPAMLALVDLTAPGMPPAGPESAWAIPSFAPRTLGDFLLLREIGRGGMGIVYEAEQVSLGRRVALKVLPMAGLLDPRQLQRFKNEARAAASLNHPHIVPVYSVGTEHAVHFYSMQLIPGQTLAAYLRQIAQHQELPPTHEEGHEPSSLPGIELEPSQAFDGPACEPSTGESKASVDTADLAAALTLGSLRSSGYFRKIAELGSQIADALDYSHSLGIVHRDVKPSNLLLDDHGKVWIADFGLAQLETETGVTMTGDLLGTLRYMSPEQALGQRGQVDGRTDIYSLGITLYELLAGRPAYSGSNRQLLLRQVIEQEPPPLRQINPSVPRDLETIVLKAIAKDPLQRYSTSQALAEDLRRFLYHQPVLAKRPTVWDRSNKWLRRHPALVTATMLVLLTMALAMGISTLLISAAYENEAELRHVAESERNKAEAAASKESEQRAKAEAAEKFAAEEAAVAKAINEFLQLDLLGLAGAEAQLDAKLEPDPDLKLATLLDRALAKLDERFADQPRVRAEVQYTLAGAFSRLGRYSEAAGLLEQVQQHLESTLGPEHRDRLAAKMSLAKVYLDQHQYDKAEAIFTQLLELERRTLGPEHPNTLALMNDLATLYRDQARYADAEPLLTQCLELERRVLGPEHPNTLASMNNLANVYQDQARFSEAEPLLTQGLEIKRRVLGTAHPDTLKCMSSLGTLYDHQGRYDEAEALHAECLEIRRRIQGPEHPDTILSMHNLAGVYLRKVRYDDAKSLSIECLEIGRRVLGPDHPNTLTIMSQLAVIYWNMTRYDEAEPLFRQCLESTQRVLGPEHPDTLSRLHNLASLYRNQARYDEAEPLFNQSLEVTRRVLGPEHPETLARMQGLASLYHDQARYDEAEALLMPCLEMRRRVLGPEHPDTLLAINNLAMLFQARARYDEAKPLFMQCLEITRRIRGTKDAFTFTTMANLGVNYKNAKQFPDALPLLEEALQGLKATLGPEHPTTLNFMYELSIVYAQLENYKDLLPTLEELVQRGEPVLGSDHPRIRNTKKNLGALYLRLNRFRESRPLMDEVLTMHMDLLGPDHPETITTSILLATACRGMGELDRAQSLFEQSLERLRSRYGADHPETLQCMNEYAVTCWTARQFERSVPMFEDLLKLREAKFGRQHPETQIIVLNLGINYKDAGRLEESIPFLEESISNGARIGKLSTARNALREAYVKTQRVEPFRKLAQEEIVSWREELDEGSVPLANVLVMIADQHLQIGLYDEAVPLLREGLQIRQREAPDAWNAFNTQSLLGAALLVQARLQDDPEPKREMLEEAERLMIAGYEGMMQRESSIPPQGRFRVPESLDRLIELYTLLEKPEEVETYRQLRSTYPPASELDRM